MNSSLARHVLDRIWDAGVRTVCVCPGARNAEWVQELAAADSRFETLWFFEERSAGFFALGRIRSTGKPVAVCTTSGTAVGELLPATMEAYYSDLPLYLLTADRPRRFRRSGAPQAAEQAGIFGIYAPLALDIEDVDGLAGFLDHRNKPVHVNVCFEDPKGTETSVSNLESEFDEPSLDEFLTRYTRPIVIVGALESGERDSTERFLLRLGAPVYLESLSGLRSSSALEGLKLKVADRLLDRLNGSGYGMDCVIRIGGVPTHRFWRDLEDRGAELPVMSVSRLAFSGLGRRSHLFCGDLGRILESAEARSSLGDSAHSFVLQDKILFEGLEAALESEPLSEPSMLHALSVALPVSSGLFLGNSLPIREWDLIGGWSQKPMECSASRGLNGIDGQLSSFLGACVIGRSNWAILGDLTALYDLAGPWVLSQLPNGLEANLVIVNNSGGKIFDRMFTTQKFQNRHMLGFSEWATQWGLRYKLVTSREQLEAAVEDRSAGLRVIELRPNPDATHRFWMKYEEVLA